MKIFNSSNSAWDEKVNFIDENNVILGYDMAQDCCENADWYITNDEPKSIDIDHDNGDLDGVNKDIIDFVFDTSYFKSLECCDCDVLDGAVFRIYNEECEKFIVIFNSHNGHYSHGFDFKDGDKEIESGSL